MRPSNAVVEWARNPAFAVTPGSDDHAGVDLHAVDNPLHVNQLKNPNQMKNPSQKS